MRLGQHKDPERFR